jgi:PhzF family phenazine biosynthesis protein
MKIPIYQVDAFTGKLFGGNPAAVCPLPEWIDASLMQSIAAENNLAETAFIVRDRDDYQLRWFTPTVEVDLCGHATLASGFAVFNRLQPGRSNVTFHSKSGPLRVSASGGLLSLDFPALPPKPAQAPPALLAALGGAPIDVLCAKNWFVVFASETDVRALAPDFRSLAKIEAERGVIATAPGERSDFVSRFFAPAHGIDEDPVTGSAHCSLTPYWAKRLGKTSLHALQVSERLGELFCEDHGERVKISGRACLYLEGEISV